MKADNKNDTIILLGHGPYIHNLAELIHIRHSTYRLLVCSTRKKAFTSTFVDIEYLQLEKGAEFTDIRDYCISHSLNVKAVLNRADRYINLYGLLVDHFGIHGPSYKAVSQFTSKMNMHTFMVKNGLEIHRPRTFFTRLEDLQTTLEKSSYPVIVKPFAGAKSRGVLQIDSLKEYEKTKKVLTSHFEKEDALTWQSNKDHSIVVEEVITGQQMTPTSYVDKDGNYHFLSLESIATVRDIGQKHMQLAFRTMPAPVSEDTRGAVNELMKRIVKASGLSSTCLLPDLIIRDGIVYLIELNVRIGGFRAELMKLAYDFDLNELALDLALGTEKEEAPYPHLSATACEVWRDQSGQIDSIILPESPYIQVARTHFQKGDIYQAPPVGNKPLATFFVRHPTDSLGTARQIEAHTVVKYIS